MPELTRRRSTDAREECWHVYYDDVLAVRSRSAAATRMTKTRGNCIAVSIRAHTQANIRTEPPPASTKPAPISKPRGRFFLAKRTEADVRAWRGQQDWAARKYAMRQAGEKLPSQKPSTLMAYAARIYAMASKINIDSRTLVTRR